MVAPFYEFWRFFHKNTHKNGQKTVFFRLDAYMVGGCAENTTFNAYLPPCKMDKTQDKPPKNSLNSIQNPAKTHKKSVKKW